MLVIRHNSFCKGMMKIPSLKELVLSYAKNIDIRRAISSGNLEELDIIWQPQIKESLKSYHDLFHYYFNYSSIFVLMYIVLCTQKAEIAIPQHLGVPAHFGNGIVRAIPS